METIKVAVDGPAGAGKSTVSKGAAKALGYLYIDTGAMYRAVGLFALQNGISIKGEPQKLIGRLPEIQVTLSHEKDGQHVFLNGKDVSGEIRTPEVSIAASDVAVIPEVRTYLVGLQQQIARENNVIMDGRDICTYVLPDAQVKIFLSASVDERARRRYRELIEKGETVDFETVKQDMEYRDKNDSTRAASPLKQAPDAVLALTDGQTLQESIDMVLKIIRETLAE